MAEADRPEPISISPLLKRLAYPGTNGIQVSAEEIAAAFALIFENRLSVVQMAALVTLLHSTGKDRDSKVIALCSDRMREAASTVDRAQLRSVVKSRGKSEGRYNGGLCDIVGTGGDSHSTFNVSTTASIIASALLLVAKHGNRSQTSLSGSADVLNNVAPVPPKISAIKASDIPSAFENTNYLFLFAPNFHQGMVHADSVRRGLGIRTIFNLMGPLANPVDSALEARVVGVAYQSLGPVFIEALRLGGARKALVVCGEEDMDEISCAGPTNCWRLSESLESTTSVADNDDEDDDDDDDEDDSKKPPVKFDMFQLHPSDFGLPTHPIEEVYTKKMPKENANKLMSILRNELSPDDPLIHFVLINTAALLVTSGITESDTSNMGPGDDGKVITERGPGGGRWKEGVRRARWAIESGQALKSFQQFIDVSNAL